MENIQPMIAVPPPQQPPLAPQIKTGGRGKMILVLVLLMLLGGGGALGYFVFPKPFYNIVGKYIGLPQPAAEEEQTAVQEEKTQPQEQQPQNLFELLPGADANYAFSLKITENAKTIVKELAMTIQETTGTNTNAVPQFLQQIPDAVASGDAEKLPAGMDKNKPLFNIEEITMVAKLKTDSIGSRITLKSATQAGTSSQFAVAFRTQPDKESELLEFLQTKANEGSSTMPILVESKGNGVIVAARSDDLALTGNFADNPLKKTMDAAPEGTNLALAIDIANIKKQLEKIAGGTTETTNETGTSSPDALAPETIEKLQSALFTATLKNENGKSVFALNARLGMEDAAAAQEISRFTEQKLRPLVNFLPETYRKFLQLNIKSEENNALLEIKLNDLNGLAQSIIQGIVETKAAEKRYQQKKKPIEEQQQALEREEAARKEGKILRPKVKVVE